MQKARVQMWLFEQTDMRLEGIIIVCEMTKFATAKGI